VAWAKAYLRTRWHPNPSNRLVTIHQRHRQTGQDRTDRQRSDRIGRTVLQTVVPKPCSDSVKHNSNEKSQGSVAPCLRRVKSFDDCFRPITNLLQSFHSKDFRNRSTISKVMGKKVDCRKSHVQLRHCLNCPRYPPYGGQEVL